MFGKLHYFVVVAACLFFVSGLPLAAQDTTPPELTAFTFTPDHINTLYGPQTVTVTVSGTDDLSGGGNFNVWYLSPSGQHLYLAIAWCIGLNCTASAEVTFPQYAEAGIWTVYVDVHDAIGNHRVYETAELSAMGFPTELLNTCVQYNFTGFFPPVDNLPSYNMAKAGSAIPVKFSLSGDMGMNILAAGYPQSVRVNCAGDAYQGAIEETFTAGSSRLSYDAATDHYVYVWKTEKSWAGTCRQLIVQLNDGSEHRANFKFTR
jgi:hypothetical protein